MRPTHPMGIQLHFNVSSQCPLILYRVVFGYAGPHRRHCWRAQRCCYQFSG